MAVMLTATTLSGLTGLNHGFLTRDGSIDEIGASPGDLVTARQVHSATVVHVPAAWAVDDAPDADALVTDRPGIVLGILTADCAPVLFADATSRVIGAAHAGWRGARDGVLEACVAAMVDLGASAGEIHAAVGPCIGFDSYEVGPEFHADFISDDAANAGFFKSSVKVGHSMFDLGGYVAARLDALGLASVEVLGCDTLADAERFWSHRRGVLAGTPETGRLKSLIRLEDS